MTGKSSRFADDVRISPDTLDDKDGMVTCSVHHTRRKAVYCERIPVLNAAKEVISYLFQCSKHSECSSSWRRGGGRGDGGSHNPSSSLDLFSGVLDCSSSSLSKSSDGRKVADTSHVIARPQGKDPGAMDLKNAENPKDLINRAPDELPPSDSLNSEENNITTHHDSKGTLKTAADSVMRRKADEGELKKDEELSAHDNSEGGKAFTPSETVSPPSTTRPSPGGSSNHISPLVAAPSTPSVATASMGGGNRYFELLERGPRGGTLSTGQYGGDFFASKKVCWNCGLLGHEKPTCMNTLCRSCHGIKWSNMDPSLSSLRHPPPHTCLPVTLSEFVVPLHTLPANVHLGLSETECVRCGERGHFDCSPPLSSSCRPNTLSCCYCGRTGHTAYDCSTRESEHADRWIQRMLWQPPQPPQRTPPYHSDDAYARGSREYSTPRSYRSGPHYPAESNGWNEKADAFHQGVRERDRSPWMSSSPSFRSYSQGSHFNDQERAHSRHTGGSAGGYHRHSSSVPSSQNRYDSRSGTERTSYSSHDMDSSYSSRSRSGYERKRFRSDGDEGINRRNRFQNR